MGRPFAEEVDYLPMAVQWAANQPIELLERSIRSLSAHNVFTIGSGGSHTAAVFCAYLHEKNFGHVSRAVTPLELAVLSRRLENTAAVLLSAEGKNTDILGATRAVLAREWPSLALTLAQDSPLGRLCEETGAATVVAYNMPWQKDGYLATNSLVATMTLLSRGYRDADGQPMRAAELTAWLRDLRSLLVRSDPLTRVAALRNVIVMHSSTSKTAAVDLESKLAEAALGFGQVVDYRQFAHGRHLQLGPLNASCGVVAFRAGRDRSLADATLKLLPPHVPVLVLDLPEFASPALREISGVVAAIAITEAWANCLGQDPGQPVVPFFGRDIHALDAAQLTPTLGALPLALRRKSGTVSDQIHLTRLAAGGETFIRQLENLSLHALICDFDGTLCDTAKRYEGLDPVLVPPLIRLLDEGIALGIATGRADSIVSALRDKIPNQYWPRIFVGCCSGSLVFRLSDEPTFPETDPRFSGLTEWLLEEGILALLKTSPKMDAGQFGMRTNEAGAKRRAIAAVQHWILRMGYKGWRVFCSAHSIDVLTENAGKKNVIDHLTASLGLNAASQVLQIGDAGDFGGNDFELLSTGCGLSVDAVSTAPESCWNFLPTARRGVQGMRYYLDAIEVRSGAMRFTANFISSSRTMLALGHRSGGEA